MNILMLTNTYTPFIGGVPRSVETFAREYRNRGNRTVIITPEFENMPEDEEDVIRVPAIQHFNGTDFSLQLPVPGVVTDALKNFRPDIVHSHHPYLIGDTALRLAAKYGAPIVFTNHTLYERYTHYVPGDSVLLRRFVIALTVGYANLCERVFAPSGSIADLLRERGVEVPVDVVPTGIDLDLFADGDGTRIRQAEGIPGEAFVVGFVSRIAPEKNIGFLARAVIRFMLKDRNTHFLVVGEGPSTPEVINEFRERGLVNRLHLLGARQGRDLVDTYHAMNVFAFASKTETQGMVVAEAMAAGAPVVALNAPGVREVLQDGENGILLEEERLGSFAGALMKIRGLGAERLLAMSRCAKHTALGFSAGTCAVRALDIYRETIRAGRRARVGDDNPWEEAKRLFYAEWEIVTNMVHAAGLAVSHTARNESLRGEDIGNVS